MAAPLGSQCLPNYTTFHNTVTWIHSLLWPQISCSHNLTLEIKLRCCITYLKVPVFLFPLRNTRRMRGLRTVIRRIRLWDVFYTKLCFTKQRNTPHHISLPKLSSCWTKNINLPHTLTISMRRCAVSRKVTGLIPDSVTGIFHWHNPSGRIMALGLTQPLSDLSTRNTSWGIKAAGAYGWQPYHLDVPIVLKSGSLNLLEPSGPVQACNGIALP